MQLYSSFSALFLRLQLQSEANSTISVSDFFTSCFLRACLIYCPLCTRSLTEIPLANIIKVFLCILILLHSFFHHIFTAPTMCQTLLLSSVISPVKEAGEISVCVWGWGFGEEIMNKGASKCIKCQRMSDICIDEE